MLFGVKMSVQINLSIIEDHPEQVPEEIQNLGTQAIQILWQTSQNIAIQEIEAVKKRYQQYEAEVLQQREEALEQVKQVKGEIVVAKRTIEGLNRENKSLQVDLDNKIGELKNTQDQITVLREKLVQQEHEIKYLTEDVGRTDGNANGLKKRLYEVNRQLEQNQASVREAREELAVNLDNRERLESEIKISKQKTEEVWKQLKQAQKQTAVAEALVQELKETGNKYEQEIKILKTEKQEIKASLEVETKARGELEKNIAMLQARSDSQDAAHKDVIARFEQEIELTKKEAASVRNRMIKAEAALEREKNAVERLETKMIAATGAKP